MLHWLSFFRFNLCPDKALLKLATDSSFAKTYHSEVNTPRFHCAFQYSTEFVLENRRTAAWRMHVCHCATKIIGGNVLPGQYPKVMQEQQE